MYGCIIHTFIVKRVLRSSLSDWVSLMMQVAWQLWTQNITCKRLDRRRVKGIDYLGCAADLKANQLEAIFNQGYRIVFETFIF